MKWPFGKREEASIRDKNLKMLSAMGFRVSPSLPVRGQDEPIVLRPTSEIAGRLAAMNAVFTYVAAPESAVPTEQVKAHIKAADLLRHMTEKERAMVNLPRAEAAAKHGDSVGWRTENSLALAWVLGREAAPAPDGTMLGGDELRALVTEWPPIDGPGYTAWAGSLRPRAVSEVAAMEDLFYCAHNAARSAQVEMMNARGKPVRYSTVPKGFDPVANGGVIHERRHSLTWVLSPGVAWEDTDLST